MGINTAAGSTLSIARDVVADGPLFSTPSTLAEFQAIGVDPLVDDWVEIGQVENLGDFGAEFQTTTFTPISNRRIDTLKTLLDEGTITATVGDDPSDAGQALLLTASLSDFNVPVRVQLNDALTNGGTPTTFYNYGRVLSNRRNVGEVTNVVRRNYPIKLNGEAFEEAAT